MRRYVINLAEATDRLDHVRQEFARFGLDFERVEAVNGRELARRGVVHPTLTPGTFACIASHVEAMQRIVESGEPWGAIFEDDVCFADEAVPFLEDAGWVPPDADLVRLETNLTRVAVAGRAVGRVGTVALHRQLTKHLGTGAYLVSRAVAERFAAFDPLLATSPIDTLLFNPSRAVLPRAMVLQAIPAIAIQEQVLAGEAGARLASSIEPDRRLRRAERYDGLFGFLREATRPQRHRFKAWIRTRRQDIVLRRFDPQYLVVPFAPRSEG